MTRPFHFTKVSHTDTALPVLEPLYFPTNIFSSHMRPKDDVETRKDTLCREIQSVIIVSAFITLLERLSLAGCGKIHHDLPATGFSSFLVGFGLHVTGMSIKSPWSMLKYRNPRSAKRKERKTREPLL